MAEKIWVGNAEVDGLWVALYKDIDQCGVSVNSLSVGIQKVETLLTPQLLPKITPQSRINGAFPIHFCSSASQPKVETIHRSTFKY